MFAGLLVGSELEVWAAWRTASEGGPYKGKKPESHTRIRRVEHPRIFWATRRRLRSFGDPYRIVSG
jgi:hypothetical protein